MTWLNAVGNAVLSFLLFLMGSDDLASHPNACWCDGGAHKKERKENELFQTNNVNETVTTKQYQPSHEYGQEKQE